MRRKEAEAKQLALVEQPVFALGMARVRIANAATFIAAGVPGAAQHELKLAESALVDAQGFITEWSQYPYRRTK